jgi:membrane-bound lytic murein transglycosylase B
LKYPNYNDRNQPHPGKKSHIPFMAQHKSSTTGKRKWLCLLLACVVCVFFVHTSDAQDGKLHGFSLLQQKLIADGFPEDVIRMYYSNPKMEFEIEGVSSFFVHSEARLDYNQYLKSRLMNRARTYMRNQAIALSQAEKKYGVNRRVVTAIILIETLLGKSLGTRTVFNTLSTMAALQFPGTRKLLWDEIEDEKKISKEQFEADVGYLPADLRKLLWKKMEEGTLNKKSFDQITYPLGERDRIYLWKKINASEKITPEAFEEKADRRSSWAYKELKAFLTYVIRENIDPFSLTGSYAGAMGVAQFMPTNILKLGQDGNGDGRVDLFNHSDAIASIANYLKYYGWKPGLKRKEKFDVIYTYNHSKYYVNAVLKIMARL